MKKDLKYFETEIKRITEEFEDYKKKHMGTPKPGEVVEISGMVIYKKNDKEQRKDDVK